MNSCRPTHRIVRESFSVMMGAYLASSRGAGAERSASMPRSAGFPDDQVAKRRPVAELFMSSGRRLATTIGHGDWEAHNLRWTGSRPWVVHDWDSAMSGPRR